jgi:hypothetical protein
MARCLLRQHFLDLIRYGTLCAPIPHSKNSARKSSRDDQRTSGMLQSFAISRSNHRLIRLVHGRFLRPAKFWQNGAILPNAARIEMAEPLSVGNRAQATENVRKNSLLNYESLL